MKKIPYYINRPSHNLRAGLTNTILKESNSQSFHRALPGYEPTPLRELKGLAGALGVRNIYVKDESRRYGLNAFKALGASYAIHRILENDPEVGTFCTATDGNHGRSVAWSAKLFGKQARVFVPKETTRHRIEAIEKEGAIVEKLNLNYDETCFYAAKMSKEKGWQLVQDTCWEGYEEIPALIKAGYLTQFQELENNLHSLPEAKVDLVFLQAGVGSWPAAAAWYYQNRYGAGSPKLVIVEPTEASGILESFRKGERTIPAGSLETMMAGLNCGIPSLTAWEILKETVDVAMEIKDSYAAEAMRKFYNPMGQDPKIISGESGAGGLAGFLALMTDPAFEELKKHLDISGDTRVLVYSTEEATDPENFNKIIGEESFIDAETS